ncbi:unnamed protein product, partial [Meganyctiphanes norvegica]
NESFRRNLLRSKLNFHSLEGLNAAKENMSPRPSSSPRTSPSPRLLPARSTPIRYSMGSMNPIIEVSPNKDNSRKSSPYKENRSLTDSSLEVSPLKESPLKDSPSRDSSTKDSPTRDSPVRNSPYKESLNEESPTKWSDSKQSPSQENNNFECPERVSLLKESSLENVLKESPLCQSPKKLSPFREVDTENFLQKEFRGGVTITRSATVAGDLKGGAGCFAVPRNHEFVKKTPPKKPPRARAMSMENLVNSEVERLQKKQQPQEQHNNHQTEAVATKKRRSVIRAPSRLYRFNSHPPGDGARAGRTAGSTEVPDILGPEFVLRSKEEPKMVTLLTPAQAQCGVVKKVTIVLVTGSRLELSCDPTSARVSHILQAVMEVENFPLPHLFGLAVLGSGEFHFVAPQTKLHKVAPPGWKERHPTKDGLMQDNFTLHLRIMYYLRFSNVHKLDVLTRRLIYLQLRHDLLEGRLPLPRLLPTQYCCPGSSSRVWRQQQSGGRILPVGALPV